MKKAIKICTGLIVCIALVMAMSVNVLAVEENIEITGAANVTVGVPASPVFTAATHNGAINVGTFIGFAGSNEDVCITDATGTNSGWKFSVAVTDFYAQSIDDPTDCGTEDMDVFIAVGDWLSLTIDNSAEGISSDDSHTLVSGTMPVNGAVVPADKVLFFGSPLPTGTPNGSVISTDTINVMTVDPGYGAGIYMFDLNYKIMVDGWLPNGALIDSTASAGERFDDMTIGAGDMVQVFAGVYSTNITYSVSCNPAS